MKKKILQKSLKVNTKNNIVRERGGGTFCNKAENYFWPLLGWMLFIVPTKADCVTHQELANPRPP